MTSKRQQISLGLALVVLALTAGGCTQMPTEKQSVVDLRAQISFRLDDSRVASSRVIVDGLDMGPASDYQEGKASLRLLPGTHRLELKSGGATILEEKFYVGDGVSRTFGVK